MEQKCMDKKFRHIFSLFVVGGFVLVSVLYI